MLKRKNVYLKMMGLVILGVAFSSKIKDFIGNYVPALKDILDKADK